MKNFFKKIPAKFLKIYEILFPIFFKKIKIGDEFLAEIGGLSPTGDGVAKIDGKVIFVENAIPAQKIRGKIVRKKRRVFFAKILEILKKSPHERPPLDAHFLDFGGAPFQILRDEAQLFWKRQFVVDAFSRIGKIDFPEIDAVAESPQKTEYRNKMEFSFGFEKMRTETAADGTKTHFDENPALGFHKKGNWREITRIEKSCLAEKCFFEIAKIVENFALKSKCDFWNPFQNRGFWKNLVVRRSKKTGEILVKIIFDEKFEKHFWKNLVETLKKNFPEIVGILAENGEKTEILFGRNFYREILAGKTFRVAHDAFFQINTAAAENLVATISDFLKLEKGEKLLDLFCGAGALGIAVATAETKLFGVEIVENAVADARKNAAENHKNAKFWAGDAAKILAELSENFDAAIVDPPRAGLSKKARKLVANLPAKKIAMISCNPATLARDLAEICREKWRVARIKPVDLFPQTPHIETVALLTRKVF